MLPATPLRLALGRRAARSAATVIALLVPVSAHAATCVWKAGSAANFNASTANWSCAAIPGSGDNVYFCNGSCQSTTGTNVNCTITSGITVNSINLGTSYGAIVSAGSNTVDVNGDFTQSTGTFTAPSSRLSVGGAFSKTGGTFSHNSGSVVLKSSASKTFATNGATFFDLAINDGLVGYWKLDEGSGTTAADASGYGIDGTVSGVGATWQPSVPGTLTFNDPKSIALNGSTGYVALGTSGLPANNAAQTLSLWAKLNTTGGSQNLIALTNGSNSAIQIKISGTNLGSYAWGGGTYVTTTAPSTGVWHHIAYTYNGSSGQALYIDGAATTATTSNQSGSTTAAYLGTYSPNSEMFNGSVDDVRIYNRALASTEIATLAAGGIPNTGTGVQNVTGNPTVADDLTIGSGTLSAGSATITVAGNWWNYGGRFTPGTSTVAFNGSSSGKYLLLDGQTFNNLTISGTGGWSFAEPGINLTLGGTFAQSAGTFTSTSGLLEINGAFNKTGGTFTHNSGGVMLASTSNQTFSPNGTTFNNLVINDGLAGYWRLDENAGTSTADGSGYGNGGTLTNGPTWTTSIPTLDFKNTSGVTFDGTNDFVDIGAPATSTNAAFTACGWVKFNSLTGYQEVVSVDGNAISGFFVEKDSPSNKFTFNMHNGDSVGATAYQSLGTTVAATGTWYHVCGVYTGSVSRIYVNGTQEGSDVTVSSSFVAGGDTILGACLWSGGRTSYLNGSLDEVRIYSRALTKTEIYSLYLGAQPGTSVATQTMSGTATVSGDLTIASGSLYLSTNTINLAGNWWNYGGLFWGDYWAGATLNLTGSATTNYIRSAGQVLPTINITGTGKWTLADDLDVDPNDGITFTSGSLDILTRTLRVGDLNSGSGTFTASSGTVVLNSNANQSVNVSGFNVLRVEDPTETGLAGYWKLDEGQGSSSRDWTGGGRSAALANGPSWSTSAAPTEFVNGGSVQFVSASSSYLDMGSGVTTTNTAHSMCAWVYLNTLSGYNSYVSINGAQVSAANIGRDVGGKFATDTRSSDSTGATTTYTLLGTTTPTTATWYHLCSVFDGSVLSLYVNGNSEGTPLTIPGASQWNATGHATIGGSIWSGGMTNFFSGYVDDVRIYSVALSATQIKALAAGRYAGTGGTSTVTLGANATVGSTFAIDSGNLNTSGSTFGTATTDASKVAYVSGGTLTVGASTATFNGGLTVRDEGTLSMQTTGGVTALGSGKTLTIDGTLDASTTGVTPTIQSASGSYTFTVGSSATATPVLNINGLAVKNTGIDGMYINAVAGSSTTFTKFDNLAFSSGSTSVGSTFLRIYSTSLNLMSGGDTFTFASAHPDYAVKLAGNGTSDGETRAIFGALCPSSLCTSSNKADNDANNDGVGDTPASNAAVVQFVRAAPSDTAGTIEGFPTAAFNWNTFAYYSTYVGYRNFSGSQDRLFVRASSGSASYSWDLPTAAGHLVGTPRWTQLSGTNYVYVGTTAGSVYKLVDNGTSLALAASPWDTPYCYGGSPCSANDSITSPLGVDGTNVYWVGTDSGNNRKFFILTHGKSLTSAALTIPAAVTAAPAEATITSVDYLFAGMQGFLYKIKISDQSSTSWTQPATTSTINGRVTILSGLAYLPDNMGHIYAVNTSSLATDWSYQDTATHGGSCTNGGNCTIKNLYVDYPNLRVMYGDQDGHVYVITKNGASATVMTGYPIQPASGEVISTAPLYQAGIMLVGTASGSLFVVNLRTVSSGTPATLYTYKLGSAISTIAYNSNTNSGNGAYMVGTASGKLIFIDRVTDSDGFQ